MAIKSNDGKWTRNTPHHGSLIDEAIDLYQHDNVSPFWDNGSEPKYTDLNNVTSPSELEIANYQLKKIQSIQKNALSKKNNNVDAINKLFISGNINTLPADEKRDQELKLNQVISNIVGTINGTYKDNATTKKNYNYDSLRKKLENLQNQLLFLKKQLNINSTIYGNYLNDLGEAIKACELKDLSSEAIQKWYNRINLFKGDIVEEIGTAWLNELKIPNIKTITTGSIYLDTNQEGRTSGQLIQDLLTLYVPSPDVLDKIKIKYKLTDNKTYVEVTLDQFIKMLESNSGRSKMIHIDDETYTTLLGLSELNIQAKAGFNQTPWNASANTQVSIDEFKADAKLGGVGVRRIFFLLHSLNQENPTGRWVKRTSSNYDYNAMANYGLATVLAKILHLSEKEGNQYLLTPQGFTTYTERIEYLMEKHHTAIEISSSVTIGADTLTKKYKTSIPKEWNRK